MCLEGAPHATGFFLATLKAIQLQFSFLTGVRPKERLSWGLQASPRGESVCLKFAFSDPIAFPAHGKGPLSEMSPSRNAGLYTTMYR